MMITLPIWGFILVAAIMAYAGLSIGALLNAAKCPCLKIASGMKTVYICSPLAGDIPGNVQKAKGYCRDAIKEGVIPIAPHVYFTEFLDDMVTEERDAGRAMGADLLRHCDEIWVFGNRVTEGMRSEIQRAHELGIDIVRMSVDSSSENQFGGKQE